MSSSRVVTISLYEDELSALMDMADRGCDDATYLIGQGEYEPDDEAELSEKVDTAQAVIRRLYRSTVQREHDAATSGSHD